MRGSVSGWMNEYVHGWAGGQVSGGMCAWMDTWMDEQIHVWMDGWVMRGWMYA
jgi:hypothetical protein